MNISRFTLIGLLGIVIALGGVFPVNAQESLVLGRATGYTGSVVAKVLREAYQKIGIQITLNTFPAKRSLVMANEGDVDGDTHRIRGIEATYSNLLMVPVPVTVMEGMVFTKNVTFAVTGWDSLKPYIIGIRRGIFFAEKGTRGMQVESVTDYRQLLLKLDAERNDVVIMPRLSGLFELQKLQIQGVKLLDPPLVRLELYHYLHKKHEALVPLLTKVLQKMKKKGRIRAIRKQAIDKLLKRVRRAAPAAELTISMDKYSKGASLSF